MAKFVIAGISSCPFYARAELIADELQGRLPDFSVHKILLSKNQWKEFVDSKITEFGWQQHDGKSPLIWRELVNRGGKGVLIGGCNEFLEHANEYYGITSSSLSEHLLNVALENDGQCKDDTAEQQRKAEAFSPYRVTITNAASPLAYSLIFEMFSSGVLEQPVILSLLDTVNKLDALQAHSMEIYDCAFPSLHEVVLYTNPQESFQAADLVLILGEFHDENREDVQDNHETLRSIKTYAEAISSAARLTVKVIVANELPEITGFLLTQFGPAIARENIFAVVRHEENTIKSVIAQQLSIKVSDVKNVAVVGSSAYGDSRFVDVTQVRVVGCDTAVWAPHIPAFSLPLQDALHDDTWVENELEKKIQARRNQYRKTHMKMSSAICSQIQDIITQGQKDNTEFFSLGVVLKNQNGIMGMFDGIVASMPVRHTQDGMIVDVNFLNDVAGAKQALTTLQEQCNNAMEVLKVAD